MEEVTVPEPGINDVLIRILKTGICGTDVHIYNWDDWAQKTIPVGLIVGHEFVGRVESIGKNVTGFQPGDLVSGSTGAPQLTQGNGAGLLGGTSAATDSSQLDGHAV